MYRFILLIFCFPGFASFSQSLIINEIGARNSTTIYDNFSQNDDWIEIFNNSSSAVNLNGYYITDDRTLITKFKLTSSGNELTIKPGEYLVLWADDDVNQGSAHLNFKLSGNGEFLGLYSPSQALLDSFAYNEQITDISYGRDLTDKSVWRFYKTPSPGSANNGSFYTEIANPPLFNITSGIFSSPINIILNGGSDSVYYTLNNSTPSYSSTLYKNAIPITQSTVVRSFSSYSSKIKSKVNSHIYLRNVNHTLPILAMISDNGNLFGNKGIYTNYDSSGTRWERFAQFKYINNNTLINEFNAGIRIQGASSRNMDKKSFRLYFRDTYGQENLDYPIFNNTQEIEFNKLVLKSGYDDDLQNSHGTLLRDALSVELYKKSGGLPQLSKWLILYIDTAYWGVYNLRENIDEDFIKSHTILQDFDLVRFASEGTELHYGTMDKWNSWYNYVRTTDFSKPENYRRLTEMIDINEFINLMAFVHCAEYRSWAWGISMFREKAPLGKWNFSIWDTDRAYTETDWNGFEDIKEQYTYRWANVIAYQIYKSSEFRFRLRQRIEELLNTAFLPNNAISVLDSIYDIVKPEIPREISRWGSIVDWEKNVEEMREFLRNRPDTLRAQMSNYLEVESPEIPLNTVTLVVNPNPVSTSATVSFYLSKACKIKISVFNIEGKLVENIFDGKAASGENKIVWNINSVINKGTYIISMQTPQKVVHTKLIIVK